MTELQLMRMHHPPKPYIRTLDATDGKPPRGMPAIAAIAISLFAGSFGSAHARRAGQDPNRPTGVADDSRRRQDGWRVFAAGPGIEAVDSGNDSGNDSGEGGRGPGGDRGHDRHRR